MDRRISHSRHALPPVTFHRLARQKEWGVLDRSDDIHGIAAIDPYQRTKIVIDIIACGRVAKALQPDGKKLIYRRPARLAPIIRVLLTTMPH